MPHPIFALKDRKEEEHDNTPIFKMENEGVAQSYLFLSQGLFIESWVLVRHSKHITHMTEWQSQNHVLSRPPMAYMPTK